MSRTRNRESDRAMEPTVNPEDRGPHLTVSERKAKERRIWRAALLASVVLHVLIFVLGPGGSVFLPMEAALGPDQDSDDPARGAVSVVSLSSAPPRPIPTPAEPTVEVEVALQEVVTPETAPEIEIEVPEVDRPGVGSTVGQAPEDGDQAGLPDASGGGDAGDAESGRAGLIPPAPRGLIIPPTNRDLRGSEIQVWVFVDTDGRVVADSTRLEPPTGDSGFDERLVSEAAEWVFQPATENGTPVSAWFPYRINM